MARIPKFLLVMLVAAPGLAAQSDSDAMSKAMAQGDLFESKHKYDLALDAYHKADKLARHENANCYLKLASVERKLGDFSSALDDTKKAIKVSGDDKTTAIKAHTMRAILLVRQSGKPTDKKLREAEDDMRQAIALDSQQALSHFNLGTILMKQERDADGIAELNQSLAIPGLDQKTAAEARKFIASPIRAREPFAPDFNFVAKENEPISNATLRGKVVLLDFWGTWCPPCRESIPTVKNVKKKFANKGFELVGISSDDDEDVWRTFVESKQMDWHEYIDLSGEVLQAFNIDSFPTYIVLDKDGVIRYRQSGFGDATEGDLEDAINKALKRNSDPALAKAVATSAKEETETVPIRGKSDEPKGAPAESFGAGRPFGIEAWTVGGNVYTNEALSMTYEFPKGWSAAKAESVHELNVKAEAAAKASILQQHPEMAQHVNVMMPVTVFYASKRGEGNPQRLSLPCIRINATPARMSQLSLETFQKMADNMAVASSAKVMGPASKYEVKEHAFLRVDMERNVGGTRLYQAYVQTLSDDYLLTVEIYATSADELEKIGDTLQAMVIKDDE
jgi:thiol-disulfide isomerase/thioredoxin